MSLEEKTTRRVTPAPRFNELEHLAKQILQLSYTGMKELACIYAACNGEREFADRLTATAKRIIEGNKQ